MTIFVYLIGKLKFLQQSPFINSIRKKDFFFSRFIDVKVTILVETKLETVLNKIILRIQNSIR